MTPQERLRVLRERFEEQEQGLRTAVDELEDAARRVVDARHWIRSRPITLTLGAFLVGFWLGGRR